MHGPEVCSQLFRGVRSPVGAQSAGLGAVPSVAYRRMKMILADTYCSESLASIYLPIIVSIQTSTQRDKLIVNDNRSNPEDMHGFIFSNTRLVSLFASCIKFSKQIIPTRWVNTLQKAATPNDIK